MSWENLFPAKRPRTLRRAGRRTENGRRLAPEAQDYNPAFLEERLNFEPSLPLLSHPHSCPSQRTLPQLKILSTITSAVPALEARRASEVTNTVFLHWDDRNILFQYLYMYIRALAMSTPGHNTPD